MSGVGQAYNAVYKGVSEGVQDAFRIPESKDRSFVLLDVM